MSEAFDRPTEPIEQPAAAPPPVTPAAPAVAPAASTSGAVPSAPVTTAPGTASPTASGGSSRARGWIDIALAVAAVVAVAGIAFAIGRITAPTTATVAANGGQFPGGQFFQGQGQGNRGFGNGGLPGGQGNTLPGAGLLRQGAIRGEVVEITSDHITLKLASGLQVTIPLDSSTTYHQQASATSGDVKSGTQVLVELAPRGTAANPSASPGTTTGGPRIGGTASDITIVTP